MQLRSAALQLGLPGERGHTPAGARGTFLPGLVVVAVWGAHLYGVHGAA